jgi:osmotically-inducible protein OsmY
MKFKSMLYILPLALSVGCATHYHEYHATSSRPIVRVYPDTGTAAAPGTPTAGMDDMDVAVRLRNRIQDDHELRKAARYVDIEIKHGSAILRGTCRTEHERAVVDENVRNFPGVMSLDDRITVGAP